MKPLTKTVRTARLEGHDWWLALYPFLLIYHCTPHSTTSVSPAGLLYNRSLCNGIHAVDTSNNLSTEQHRKAATLYTRYDHRPFCVIALKGTMVTAERAGIQRTRHISHFKPYNGPLPDEPHDLSDIDEEEEERRDPQPELEQDGHYPACQRRCPDYYVEGLG